MRHATGLHRVLTFGRLIYGGPFSMDSPDRVAPGRLQPNAQDRCLEIGQGPLGFLAATVTSSLCSQASC